MFAKSSGHWYTREGEPAYTQPNKSRGGERPTTIRDARKLDLVPSVTTIIDVMAKPGLERWKLNQLMLAALTLPAVEGEDLKTYESRLWEDANAQSEQARQRGTEIHGYIEAYFMDGKYADNPYVVAVRECLETHFGEQDWHTEKSFASPLGFGGKIDLYSDEVIIDYKTKDKIDEKPMSYLEHKMQLSAYRKGLELPDAKIANLFIGRELVDGSPDIKLEIHGDDKWAEFECLLNFWKLTKL